MVKYWRELKDTLSNHSIPEDDICIVGSFVLSLVGIRDHEDIDIMVRSNVERPEADHVINLSENIHLVGDDWGKKIGLSNDEIIDNNNYHVYYDGIKVVKLGLLLATKLERRTAKDLRDIALMTEVMIGDPYSRINGVTTTKRGVLPLRYIR